MLPRRFLLALLPLLLAGCRPSAAPGSAPASDVKPDHMPGYVKDDLGRPISVTGPAKRIIVIGPGAVETLFALGQGARVIGRDVIADYPSAAKKVAVAGDYTGPSVEKCVALHPDLVIVQGETWDESRVESWQKQIGAPVAALTATSLKAVQDDFLKMGAWTGSTAKAAQMAKTLDFKTGKSSIKAFIEVGRSPLYTAGTGTLVSDVVRAGGFANVAGDVHGYQPFGLESLIARQPSVYITSSDLNQAALVAQLRASPALSKLNCVQAGRVIGIQSDFLLRPGPRLRLGIDQLQREAQRLNGMAPPKK